MHWCNMSSRCHVVYVSRFSVYTAVCVCVRSEPARCLRLFSVRHRAGSLFPSGTVGCGRLHFHPAFVCVGRRLLGFVLQVGSCDSGYGSGSGSGTRGCHQTNNYDPRWCHLSRYHLNVTVRRAAGRPCRVKPASGCPQSAWRVHRISTPRRSPPGSSGSNCHGRSIRAEPPPSRWCVA